MINKVALLSGEVEHVCPEGHTGVFRCSRVLNLKNHEKETGAQLVQNDLSVFSCVKDLQP